MKRLIYILYIVIMQFPFSTAYCQLSTSIFGEEIPVKIQRLRQVADSVQLVMDFDLRDLRLSTDRSLVLTPTLTNGNKQLKMKNIMLNGRVRHKAFTREIQLNGWEREVRQFHYQVLNLNDNRKVLRYRQTVPYETWMDKAGLEVGTDLCGCAGHVQQLDNERVASRIILEGAKRYRAMPHVAYLRPEAEAVKARSESSNVFLDFPVARTEINPGFGNNPRELSKIEGIINNLRNDRNLHLTSVMITGFASPEGNTDFNNQLSRGRAEALRNYLAMRAGIQPHLYRVGYGGEDWRGLARLVQNSYIEPKGTILGIIQTMGGEARKQQLKMLGGGSVYQRMLHGLYPQLRRVVARIDFTVKSFNVEEAKQVIKTHPKQLSLNEMFLVANTYPEGSKEFRGVFDTAVEMFPNDPVANLNAAASALLVKDVAKAERYLQRSPRNTAEYYNNLGVLEMMKGNLPRAKNLFKKASESNLDAALQNMDEVKKKEDADKQLKN